MSTAKKIFTFMSKQVGYIVALGILTVAAMYLGMYFVSNDSHPQDAAVLTPLVTVPVAFVAGVLLSKVFNKTRRDK